MGIVSLIHTQFSSLTEGPVSTATNATSTMATLTLASLPNFQAFKRTLSIYAA